MGARSDEKVQRPSRDERDCLTAIYKTAERCVGGRCAHEYDWQCSQAWLALRSAPSGGDER